MCVLVVVVVVGVRGVTMLMQSSQPNRRGKGMTFLHRMQTCVVAVVVIDGTL